MPGANRVVIGLPERYEKAKDQLALLEARAAKAQEVIHDPSADDHRKLAAISAVLRGDFDVQSSD
jgi:hypothetical protein